MRNIGKIVYRVWKDKTNCLQCDKVKEMFAEKSGNIIKNTFTKTEIKNKETIWNIGMEFNKIWAIKRGHSVIRK